jgi:hypothetical protein
MENKMYIERIIQTSQVDASGFQVVLAKVDGVHPFVVWLRKGNDYMSGWYNADLETAMQDYIDRCKFNRVGV